MLVCFHFWMLVLICKVLQPAAYGSLFSLFSDCFGGWHVCYGCFFDWPTLVEVLFSDIPMVKIQRRAVSANE